MAAEYFHNRNNSPKKKERKEILAHLMELGDTGASDSSLVNWFTSTRQKERRNSSLLPPTFAPEPEPDEKKWLDARHKSRKFSILSSIIPYIPLIHTLTDNPWRFSLAVYQEGVLRGPRGALYRTPCPRRHLRASVRPVGGRS